jgi:hypothetical protein
MKDTSAEQEQRMAEQDQKNSRARAKDSGPGQEDESEEIERLEQQIPSYAANLLTDVLKKLSKSVKTPPSDPWFLKSIIPQPLWKKGPLQDFMGLANLTANLSAIIRRTSTLPGMKVELPCQGQERESRDLECIKNTTKDFRRLPEPERRVQEIRTVQRKCCGFSGDVSGTKRCSFEIRRNLVTNII